jgi:hypothetical protein
MKRIYEAANNIEAHMIVHLLEQSGLQAFVEGEHLQSGGGELPLGGLVAVAVAENDAVAATQIIRDWESRVATVTDQREVRVARRAFLVPLTAFILGALVSGLLVWSVHHGPESSSGVDWNEDGVLDERAYFDGDRVDRVEYDRNFDKRVDAIERYDSAGVLESFEADDDFDGRIESVTTYGGREPLRLQIDSDGDGSPDYRATYRFGVPDSYEYLNDGGKVLKKVTYRGFRPERAQLDLDGDGTWERSYGFDRYDEPTDN